MSFAAAGFGAPPAAAGASSAAASTAPGAPAGSVFVKRAGDARARFAKVSTFEGDAVADLAKRASLELGWGVSAAYVDLFLIKPADSERAFATPTQAQIDAVLADEGNLLGEGMPLSLAGVALGAWVVARLPDAPAAVLLPGQALSVGGAAGASSAGANYAGGEPPLTFERLLERGGLRRSEIEKPAVIRARIKYGNLVAQSVMEHRPDIAVEAYELGKRLPSTATVWELQVAGYKVNGLLHEGSELAICYKGDRVHLLKGLRDDEAARARSFLAALDGGSVPHVTTFDLVESEGGKHLMIMPKFSTALEPLPFLSAAGVKLMWAQLQEALSRLHALGFAHADVKPGNVCISEDANTFYLIDLGSISRFGEPTSSTAAYVPRDMKRGKSSAALDWWMLAVTLAEKACGPEHALEVGGARHHTKEELRGHLAAHLDPEVWGTLRVKLE